MQVLNSLCYLLSRLNVPVTEIQHDKWKPTVGRMIWHLLVLLNASLYISARWKWWIMSLSSFFLQVCTETFSEAITSWIPFFFWHWAHLFTWVPKIWIICCFRHWYTRVRYVAICGCVKDLPKKIICKENVQVKQFGLQTEKLYLCSCNSSIQSTPGNQYFTHCNTWR